MKKLVSDQRGIAHLAIILAVLVIGGVAATGYKVYTTQLNKEYAAHQADLEHESKMKEILKARQKAEEENKEVDIPAPAEEQKPVETTTTKTKTETKKKTEQTEEKPKKPAPAKVTITSTSSQVGADSVTLTATLDASYTGKCKALVKRTDGSSAQHFKESFGPASTCSVTVAKSNLGAGEWKFYMYVYNDEGTIWGESGHNTFNL